MLTNGQILDLISRIKTKVFRGQTDSTQLIVESLRDMGLEAENSKHENAPTLYAIWNAIPSHRSSPEVGYLEKCLSSLGIVVPARASPPPDDDEMDALFALAEDLESTPSPAGPSSSSTVGHPSTPYPVGRHPSPTPMEWPRKTFVNIVREGRKLTGIVIGPAQAGYSRVRFLIPKLVSDRKSGRSFAQRSFASIVEIVPNNMLWLSPIEIGKKSFSVTAATLGGRGILFRPIDRKWYFHATSSLYLEKIKKYGLQPIINLSGVSGADAARKVDAGSHLGFEASHLAQRFQPLTEITLDHMGPLGTFVYLSKGYEIMVNYFRDSALQHKVKPIILTISSAQLKALRLIVTQDPNSDDAIRIHGPIPPTSISVIEWDRDPTLLETYQIFIQSTPEKQERAWINMEILLDEFFRKFNSPVPQERASISVTPLMSYRH